MKAFVKREKRCATRFDAVTLRVALAVHARSKSAYDVLSRNLQLPKDRTLRGSDSEHISIITITVVVKSRNCRYFSNYASQSGSNPDPFILALEEAKRKGIPLDKKLNGILMMDEVHDIDVI